MVYAREKESFCVSVEGSASGFQRVAFRKVDVEGSKIRQPHAICARRKVLPLDNFSTHSSTSCKLNAASEAP